MIESGRPTRSWLFTPGSRSDRFAKAVGIGADALIIDLEDAVAPADKRAARQAAITYLTAPSAGIASALRINGLDTLAGIGDLNTLLASTASPDYLVLPKADSADHLLILDRLLGAAGRTTRLVGIIESARGLSQVEAVAKATPRLYGLMLGAADMAADLGATTAWGSLAYARGRLVAACALAGITPIDSPFFDVRDLDGLHAETSSAVASGFTGKAAIHPNQVAIINAALTPTFEQVAYARRVLQVNDAGIGTVDGAMIDEAVARKARRILDAARQ